MGGRPEEAMTGHERAVAIYFTGTSTPQVHLESPPLPGTLTIGLTSLRTFWDGV